MTKEWQEASEEYMKVRTSCLSHCIEYKLTPAGPRNRAHHLQEGHDDPEQVREGSPRPRETQRRVKACPSVGLYTSIPIQYLFSLGQFPLVPSVCRVGQDTEEESPLDWHCHISSPVYRILEVSPFCLFLPTWCLRHRLCSRALRMHLYRYGALQSTRSSLFD
jgi:hypothetical protein